MRNLLIVTLLLVAFVSCEKDDINVEKSSILAEYYRDRKVAEFIYNTDGTLKANSTPYAYWRYNHKERQILKESFLDTNFNIGNGGYKEIEEWANPENSYLAGTDTFNLDENNRLVSANFYNNITSTFTHNFEGLISERKIFISNRSPSNYSVNRYTYDRNGNLIKDESIEIDRKGGEILTAVIEYEHDNYINPFRGVLIDKVPGLGSDVNNVIYYKFKIMDYPDSFSDAQIEYEYNKKRMPTSRISKGITIRYQY